MAIVKVWIGDDLGKNDVGVFEIREELEHPFCVEVKTVKYQVSEDIECPPNTTP